MSTHMTETQSTPGQRHRRPFPTLILTGLAVVLLLSGCGERGDVGIFASIEREEKIEKSNLPEVSTAGSVVYHSGTDRYYVALGQLYARDRDSNEWDDVNHPGGYADGHTLDIVTMGGDIYVAFFDTESTKSEIFRLDPTNDSYSSVWSPGQEIAKLIAIDTDGAAEASEDLNEELFAVTVESNKLDYNLVYAPGDVGGTQNTVLSDVPRIFDGAYDFVVAGGQYLFVAGSTLFAGTDATQGSADIAEVAGADRPFATFGGTTFVENAFGTAANDWLYVTSTRGDIAYTADAGTWTWTIETGDDDRGYTDIEYVDLPGFTGLVVGVDTRETSPGGYYEVTESLGTSRPDGENYDAADISDAAINGFYLDAANQTLFAVTSGAGLWSGNYDTAEADWSWE